MRRLRSATVAATAAMVAAAPLGAQDLQVAAVQAWSTHDLVHSPRGVAVSIGFPILDRVAVRFGGSYLGIDANRVGSSCSGLIPPGTDCSAEPLRDTGRLSVGSIGVSVTVLKRDTFRARLIPAVHLASATSYTRASLSGRRLSAEQKFLGTGVDVEVATRPIEQWPAWVTLAWGHGRLSDSVEHIADGYTPFHAFSLTRLELGISVGLQ